MHSKYLVFINTSLSAGCFNTFNGFVHNEARVTSQQQKTATLHYNLFRHRAVCDIKYHQSFTMLPFILQQQIDITVKSLQY
jgi:hypothetical protein